MHPRVKPADGWGEARADVVRVGVAVAPWVQRRERRPPSAELPYAFPIGRVNGEDRARTEEKGEKNGAG